MMKPNFEPFVHTLRQILDRNITLYLGPYEYGWKVMFSQSDNPELREIAKTIIITKSWVEYANFTKHSLLSNGTHALLRSYMYNFELKLGREYNHGRGFYKGERLDFISPYAGYFTSKNWHLNEEFENLKYKLHFLN